MALNVTGQVFEGKAADLLIYSVYAKAHLIESGLASLRTGMKSKFVYDVFTDTGNIEAYTVCPTVFGDFNLNSIQVEMCEMSYLKEMTKNALVDTWRESKLREGFNVESPTDDAELVDVLTATMLARVKNQLDNVFINGDTLGSSGSGANLCDGILTKLVGEPYVPVSGTTLTLSNIFTEMNKVLDAIPVDIYNNTDYPFYIAVGAAAHKFIEQAERQNGFYKDVITKDANGVYFYNNYRIVYLANLPANTMIGTYGETSTQGANIIIWTDASGDFSDISVYDRSAFEPCDKIQWRMKWRSAVTISNPQYVVLYA